MVWSCTLNTSTTHWHVQLDGGCILSSRKPFIFGLCSLNNRHCKQFFVDRLVVVQNTSHKETSLLIWSMSSVPFLPQEFTSSNERSWMFKLPANNICPLIQQKRQVTMGMNPFCKTGIHDSLTCRSDCNWLWQFALSTLCHPSDLRREAFNMALFLVKSCLSYEHWEITVLNSKFFNASIKEGSNLLPDVESWGPQDVASWDFVIFNEFGFRDDLWIPLWEVLFFLVLYAQDKSRVCLLTWLGALCKLWFFFRSRFCFFFRSVFSCCGGCCWCDCGEVEDVGSVPG